MIFEDENGRLVDEAELVDSPMTDDELLAALEDSDPWVVAAAAREAIPRLLAEARTLRNVGVNQAEQIERLLAEKERLRAALMQCRSQFAIYAQLHAAKGTPDGEQKARTNEQFAVMCSAALEQGGASAPTGEG